MPIAFRHGSASAGFRSRKSTILSRSHTAWLVDPAYNPSLSPDTVRVPPWLFGELVNVSTRFTVLGRSPDVMKSIHGVGPGEFPASNDTKLQAPRSFPLS